MNPDSM